MKRCSRCGMEKPEEDFAWHRKDKGERDSYCRPCRAAYKQEHYATNKQRYIEQALARNRFVIEERTKLLMEFFLTHPCVDCGENDPVVLEFDHVGQKDFEIGNGLRDRSWASVLLEMRKCEVVCVNCHRRRTARRGGFRRHLLAGTDATEKRPKRR